MGRTGVWVEEKSLYMEFSKHFLVVQIMGEWKRLWMCMSTHLKANITLKWVRIKI
jgi:RNAse (barnase) inhibitor barstar